MNMKLFLLVSVFLAMILTTGCGLFQVKTETEQISARNAAELKELKADLRYQQIRRENQAYVDQKFANEHSERSNRYFQGLQDRTVFKGTAEELGDYYMRNIYTPRQIREQSRSPEKKAPD